MPHSPDSRTGNRNWRVHRWSKQAAKPGVAGSMANNGGYLPQEQLVRHKAEQQTTDAKNGHPCTEGCDSCCC